MKKNCIITFAVLLACSRGFSQQNNGVPANDSAITSRPLPYNKLITPDAVTTKGLFTVHKIKGRYYFEIADSLLRRSILVVNRIARSSAGDDRKQLGYAGDEMGQATVSFRKGPRYKLFIRRDNFTERAIDTSANGLAHALADNNLLPVIAAFDIKAYSPDSTASVIDVTDFIGGNQALMVGSFSSRPVQPDKSYIESVQTFPINTEVLTIKTYGTGKDENTATYQLNTSFLLLPAIPWRERNYDPRVGYFTPFHFDYDADAQQVKWVLTITRWRLEPRPEDLEKYKRGELVEPAKPIVFYIDPATPKKWVPYLIQGVNDWQAAFEKAGFKNAIMAREAPVGDSTWSLEDARNSAIVYKPSPVANAMGPSIFDPRSGEILESHVSWYHNVMSLIHDWYMVQAGAIDPAARNMEFSDSLMGQLIRFVSSHEIGHTLGLKHNFGSSSTVPVDSLRNKRWVEAHGHTPSIMDYARFNYVAQPGDGIGESGIFPRINDYDKWAIEWGYRLFPDLHSEQEERPVLFKMITDSLRHNRRLFYGEQGFFGVVDPRNQSEDLGDDAMKAGTYGIKNLQRIIARLPEWAPTHKALKNIYGTLLMQFYTYMGHVAQNIGKGYYSQRTAEEKEKVFALVPLARQRAAVAFLGRELFGTEPKWLVPREITDKVRNPLEITIAEALADDVLLNMVLSPSVIGSIHDAAGFYGRETYSLDEYLCDLDKAIWPETASHTPVKSYHRSLQQAYITGLVYYCKNFKDNSATMVVRAHLENMRERIGAGLRVMHDKETVYHYRHILAQIYRTLSSRAPVEQSSGKPMGSALTPTAGFLPEILKDLLPGINDQPDL